MQTVGDFAPTILLVSSIPALVDPWLARPFDPDWIYVSAKIVDAFALWKRLGADWRGGGQINVLQSQPDHPHLHASQKSEDLIG